MPVPTRVLVPVQVPTRVGEQQAQEGMTHRTTLPLPLLRPLPPVLLLLMAVVAMGAVAMEAVAMGSAVGTAASPPVGTALLQRTGTAG